MRNKEVPVDRHLRWLTAGIRYPGAAAIYPSWLFKQFIGHPVRRICGVRLSGFSSFSEYYSAKNNISKDEEAFLRRLVLGSGTIIDIGANLGLFTLLLRKQFPNHPIIAFEPSPSTFTALKDNVRRNRAINVSCRQIAVADYDGTVSFCTREYARANAGILSASEDIMESTIQVPCMTLDSFAFGNNLSEIAFLKVDVEGFEVSVFRGADRVLRVLRPRVIHFEVCPALAARAGFDPAETAAYLANRGYDLYRVARDGHLKPINVMEISEIIFENCIALAS